MYMHVYMVLWEGTRRCNSSFGRRASVSHWKDILVQWQISLSFLSVSLSLSISFCLLLFKMKDLLWFTGCFRQGRQCWVFFLSLHLLLYAVAFGIKCAEVCSTMGHSSVVFVHVFPHVSRVVLCCQWVCLIYMYPASICQLLLWAAGLLSTSQAQVAFDNGLNRQMPGRHLAIDHSREHSARFLCSPAGEQYLRPADWPTPWSHSPVILSSFHCLPSFPDLVDVYRRAALLSKS